MSTSVCLPLVPVVVPARDEEEWIDDCLASIAAQDYPQRRLEVVVGIDGASPDATATRAHAALEQTCFHRPAVVRNPDGGTPKNLTTGLAAARGDLLCRVDARSRIQTGYVRRRGELLTERPDVVV